MFLRRKKTETDLLFNHAFMMEETAIPGKDDRKVVIDLPNEERILHWANQLSCSRADLLYAVLNVGHSYKAVEAFLCMNHRQHGSSGGRQKQR